MTKILIQSKTYEIARTEHGYSPDCTAPLLGQPTPAIWVRRAGAAKWDWRKPHSQTVNRVIERITSLGVDEFLRLECWA